mgnify:CR=1 FL=1
MKYAYNDNTGCDVTMEECKMPRKSIVGHLDYGDEVVAEEYDNEEDLNILSKKLKEQYELLTKTSLGREECDTTDNILNRAVKPKMGLFGGFGTSSKIKQEKSEPAKEMSNFGFGPPRNRPNGNKK